MDVPIQVHATMTQMPIQIQDVITLATIQRYMDAQMVQLATTIRVRIVMMEAVNT
ncbi:MAG: hypothetical protein JWP09_764 [Candidatus Taylorbacteria bacterium]|nr:hypothetical protein [Candidatus Taylorbacteria bacterium]